jgi:hypothetical protein
MNIELVTINKKRPSVKICGRPLSYNLQDYTMRAAMSARMA